MVKWKSNHSAQWVNNMSANILSDKFNKKFEWYVDKINQQLDKISTVPDVPQSSVYEAMRYSLMAGGKRIRPMLCVAVAEMLGGDVENAIKVACAIECIHTYSLIHDDLPCMDNDELRRGKPTCHMVYPENIALLAGDGLLNKAFEILTCDCIDIDDSKRVKLIKSLSKASGTDGMIGGQVIDLEGEDKESISLDELINMHANKTGALIEVSTKMGCILGNLTGKASEEYKHIHDFSSKVGLTFQIKDDILDVTGNLESLGKNIGSDAESGKNTFVTILGLDGATDYLKSLTDESISALDYFGDDAWFLRELGIALLRREN